jgi:hypothetical protein
MDARVSRRVLGLPVGGEHGGAGAGDGGGHGGDAARQPVYLGHAHVSGDTFLWHAHAFADWDAFGLYPIDYAEAHGDAPFLDATASPESARA